MKKLIITLCSLGLMFSLAQAQQNGPGGPGYGDGSGNPPADVPPPPPDIIPPDVGNEIPEEIVLLHQEVKALRDALRDSRQAVLEGLDEDATREERMEALETWRTENSEQIEEVRSLSEELRALVRENRPNGPWVDVPEEIVALREQLHAQRQVLAESRQQVIAGLGENPTDEEVRAAIEAWRETNADAIAEAQNLAEQLREWFRANRPDRPGAAFSPGMALRREAFRNNIREMQQNRMQLRTQLQNPDLTDPERQQIMATFREQQRELMQERKSLKRQQRISQGGVGGDRRPGG
jgi:post-segregation antitoxin (ccd killing protein)